MQSPAFTYKWLAATLSPEALITSLSSGAEQFTGYSAQELVGRPVSQILAEASAGELRRNLDSADEWGYWEGEILHRTRDGRTMEARGTLSVLTSAGNRSSGYLLISNLNHASLLLEGCADPAITEIAGHLRTFAHDLNNPLAVILGFTQLLMLNPECQGKFRSEVEKIYSESKRMIQVVERLHVYAMSFYEQSSRQQTPAAG